MSQRRDGPIGLFSRRPGLCLALVGSILQLASLVSLAIVRFEDTASRSFRPGPLGWTSFGSIPVAFFMLAGIVGLATGTGLLIAAVYVNGQPTRWRLAGCTLAGVGLMTIAVGHYHRGNGWALGLLLLAIGIALVRRSSKSAGSVPSG